MARIGPVTFLRSLNDTFFAMNNRQEFICSTCGLVTNYPKGQGYCNNNASHHWTPIPLSVEQEAGNFIENEPSSSAFNKKLALVGALALAVAAFVANKDNPENVLTAIVFAGAFGYIAGGFVKNIVKLALGAAILFAIIWALDFFKIVDLSKKAEPTSSKKSDPAFSLGDSVKIGK